MEDDGLEFCLACQNPRKFYAMCLAYLLEGHKDAEHRDDERIDERTLH
jgi:hypothetical protein